MFSHRIPSCAVFHPIAPPFLAIQGLNELPLLKSGEIEIPKRWHMNNDSLHLLDVFRDWRCPPGLRLLMGLLKYDPLLRLTAEKALAADYFTTLVGFTPASLL